MAWKIIDKGYLVNLNDRITSLKLIHKSLQSSGEISGYEKDQEGQESECPLSPPTNFLKGPPKAKETASPRSEISFAAADFV